MGKGEVVLKYVACCRFEEGVKGRKEKSAQEKRRGLLKGREAENCRNIGRGRKIKRV